MKPQLSDEVIFQSSVDASISMRQSISIIPKTWNRTHSDTYETESCLLLATIEPDFEYNVTGSLSMISLDRGGLRSTTMDRNFQPMEVNDETQTNLGKVSYECAFDLSQFKSCSHSHPSPALIFPSQVHYQLACLMSQPAYCISREGQSRSIHVCIGLVALNYTSRL